MSDESRTSAATALNRMTIPSSSVGEASSNAETVTQIRDTWVTSTTVLSASQKKIKSAGSPLGVFGTGSTPSRSHEHELEAMSFRGPQLAGNEPEDELLLSDVITEELSPQEPMSEDGISQVFVTAAPVTYGVPGVL